MLPASGFMSWDTRTWAREEKTAEPHDTGQAGKIKDTLT